ncbi:hypothetical protein ABAC460_08070 [Asticcacaulis sp. AC460]|uniref:hypothetical protein n=1 Tax=Asticcacaulis sp. AC460 TaxID=1282360 RepID=UPI0003C3D217|nr:hypothetical protein [Asticcacaulis sp. AC460]ESQ90778.1 hypothetical protein ABAC460_08070 [Asticcacaulis sp. AC460]
MIANIIDKRTRPYRWKRIQAIIEAVWHDNACADSDQADVGTEDGEYILYDARDGISVSEAISWAHGFVCPVTLYLYDEGTN